MKYKNDRRVRKTKRVIKDSLLELLQEIEIQKISVTQLCQKADINRKTFYNHYGDIRSVLDEIEDEYIDKYLSYLDKENILYDLADLSPFVERLTDEIDQNPDIYTIVSKGDEYIYIKEKIKNHLTKYLNEITKQKPSIDSELFYLYVGFIAAGIASVYQEWLMSQKQINKEKLNKLISSIISSGSNIFIENTNN